MMIVSNHQQSQKYILIKLRFIYSLFINAPTRSFSVVQNQFFKGSHSSNYASKNAIYTTTEN